MGTLSASDTPRFLAILRVPFGVVHMMDTGPMTRKAGLGALGRAEWGLP
jgi:hypothetical protein